MTPPAVRLEATRINQARVSIVCSLDKSAHNETVAFDSMIFIRSAVVPKKKTSFKGQDSKTLAIDTGPDLYHDIL